MTDHTASPAAPRWATVLGLALALLSPFAAAFFPEPKDFAERMLRGTLLLGGVTVVVLVILTVIERQPLASIGLRRPGWGALGFGLLGLVGLLIAQPIGALLQQAAHGRPSPSVFRDMGNLPLWLLVLLPFRAAITEEILFRGYAMTRVESLTRSRVLAFLIPGVLFCLAHVPTFGLTYALAVAPLAVVLGALFLWKRNLWANMIAHAGVDALALAAAWAFAHGLFKVPGA